MKELFWVGSKDCEGFQSQQELQHAISDIESIGWNVADLGAAIRLKQKSGWDVPGAVICENGVMGKVSLAEMMDPNYVDFVASTDVLKLTNPNCGINVIERRPPVGEYEKLTIANKAGVNAVAYYDQTIKNKCYLSINDRIYTLNPILPTANMTESSLSKVNTSKYLDTDPDHHKINVKIADAKEVINAHYQYIKYLFIICIIICIMVAVFVFIISKEHKTLTKNIDILSNDLKLLFGLVTSGTRKV
jgi:hypothetical protein